MVTGVIDFKDRDEGDGFCFKMQVDLNYDHNHALRGTSLKCIKKQNRDNLNS